MKKYKVAVIEWIDSKGGSFEWEYLDDIESLEPIYCQSLGFLIEYNENYKTLAPTMGGDQIWGRITIPSCSVVKFQILSY